MNRLSEEQPLLQVRSLKTYFFTLKAVVRAVDGVTFHLLPRETLGIVGESGCGKTVTALSIMRLFPSPPGKIVEGEILFAGKDLAGLPEADIRRIRGNQISMIFQEPMTSLNPLFTIGDQIMEPFIHHRNLPRKEARTRTIEMLGLVGIPSPERRIKEFPHQLSGGMRQRVMIAMALSSRPQLLIADEPTTALDVTIQAQILDLMVKLKEQLGTAIMLITHNMGVIAQIADRVLIMYAGKVVEEAPVKAIFENPSHPYTQGLLHSIPRMGQTYTDPGERLQEIPGSVPSLFQIPRGCSFHPRCQAAMEICRDQAPDFLGVGEAHFASCWLHKR
jgi:oligopeptide/dipeptide ABC transporter ATP-binding protein